MEIKSVLNTFKNCYLRPCFDLRSSRAITSLCKQLSVCYVSLYLTDIPTVLTIIFQQFMIIQYR